MNESYHKHKSKVPMKLNFAVIVSSSSRYQKLKERQLFTDPSGDLIVKLVEDAGHSVVSREILPDDRVLIGNYVGDAIGSNKVDAIIIFWSKTGNTEKEALAIQDGLKNSRVNVSLKKVGGGKIRRLLRL